MKNIAIATAALSFLTMTPAFGQAVQNTDANVNTNNSTAGSSATGGNSDNKNVTVLDDRDYNRHDSEYWNMQQVYPMQLNNVDQMINNRIGTVNCAVEEQGGTEFRLGFPPSIVFKDQTLDGGECLAALNSLARFTQADVLQKIVLYVDGLESLSPTYKRLLKQELSDQILDLFLDNRVELQSKARTSDIEMLKSAVIENSKSWEERSKLAKEKALREGRNKIITTPLLR